MILLVSAAAAQQQIPTGGPIPDRRDFNNSVDDPKLTGPIEEVVRRVAGNVYVIAGAGGNIFAVFYPRIMAALRQISDKPVRMIVNTRSHFDHNQNNTNFAKQGASIFAHPNLRMALMQQTRPPVPPAGLPVATSSEPLTFHFNGEEISYIPLKPSHTNGDVALYFHGSDVFAFGDVLRQTTPPSASHRAAPLRTSSTITISCCK